MPIAVSAGLSLWYTRPVAQPFSQRAPAASPADDDQADDSVALADVSAKASSDSSKADNNSSSSKTSGDDDESAEKRMRRRRAELLASQPAQVADPEAAAEALMREYAPNMSKRLQHMPAGGQLRTRLERQMVERGRELLRMKQRDPEQFKHELEQVQLEDEVADLGRQVLGRGQPSKMDSETLRKTLHEKIAQLVDLRLRNRQARLDRLEKTLDTEKSKLAADQSNRDKLVERQFNAVVNHHRPIGGVAEGTLAAPGPRRAQKGSPRSTDEPKTSVQASPASRDSKSDDDSK
jgi:hypothetical protein